MTVRSDARRLERALAGGAHAGGWDGPELALVARLEALPRPEPDPGWRAAVHALVVAEAAQARPRVVHAHRVVLVRRFAPVAVAALLVVAVVTAPQGSPLQPVRAWVEQLLDDVTSTPVPPMFPSGGRGSDVQGDRTPLTGEPTLPGVVPSSGPATQEGGAASSPSSSATSAPAAPSAPAPRSPSSSSSSGGGGGRVLPTSAPKPSVSVTVTVPPVVPVVPSASVSVTVAPTSVGATVGVGSCDVQVGVGGGPLVGASCPPSGGPGLGLGGRGAQPTHPKR